MRLEARGEEWFYGDYNTTESRLNADGRLGLVVRCNANAGRMAPMAIEIYYVLCPWGLTTLNEPKSKRGGY